ncbi:MAG TPA: hypothetical protein VK506_09230 [Conexibacter sp.]|nr:hypothetical protein [Conexibacter sp.]
MHHRPLRAALAVVLVALASLVVVAGGASADDYVALGDSYSSGVGTKSFFEATCKRSSYAYPRLVAANRPGTSLVFRACSGATTSSVLAEQVSSVNAGPR